ncbi:MAG: nucleotidyltransferase domain-containing protein [Nitrospirae bacterium]|nr:nucleotidyltransferase domain-containing protein [Nitrospirota bacterium]MCL5978781.1 nucleotidyltransferase domain-containing protein [Nitrospirota bacterium]
MATVTTENIMSIVSLIAKKLKEEYRAKEVILFGSYARGEAHEDSDIDLLVIADTKERLHERIATVLKLLRGLIRYTPLSPIVLTPDELEIQLKKHNQFIEEIIERGIRI